MCKWLGKLPDWPPAERLGWALEEFVGVRAAGLLAQGWGSHA